MLRLATKVLFVLSLAGFAHAQLPGGTGFGTPAAETGGGDIGANTGGSLGNTGGGQGGNASGAGNQGITATSATQGLTGNRETALQSGGFLGNNAQNTRGFMADPTIASANGGFGNAGNFGGRGGAAGGGRGQQPQQQRSTRVIRTRITIPRDFGSYTIPKSKVRAGLNSQFQRVSSQRAQSFSRSTRLSTAGLRGSNVTASLDGKNVVLTGRVSSQRDSRIAEKMAKMEPGVESVVNRLTIVPQP